jgi:hypothetical protein
MLALLMLLQSMTGPPGDDAVYPVTRPARCVRNGEEIMVCGTSAESQRLQALPEPGTRRVIPQAAVQISPNKRALLRGENNPNPTVSAPRAMLDFTVGF